MEIDKIGVLTAFLFAVIKYSIPLLYGTMGEILVEKSGSLNLGVEGIMAVGALVGYLCGCYTNSLLIGIAAAFLAAALCGLLFAFLTVTLQANQNITGLTLTTFGVGLFFFLSKSLGGAKVWPDMKLCSNIQDPFVNGVHIPLLSDIPLLGQGLFSHNILVYLGIALAILMWWYLNRTAPGMKLRAVGENPAAADSVGVNVTFMKYLHICIGSGIMGIGGYYMGLNMGGALDSNCWTNGYGWIAVALVIFANWNPALAIAGTFVFGLFNILETKIGSLRDVFPMLLGWSNDIPPKVYQALPFLITAIVLVVTSIRKKKNSGLPAALGLNYFREER